MLKTLIIGASGYTGAELAAMVVRHPQLTLAGIYVSEGSLDAGRLLSDLHPQFKGVLDIPLQPMVEVSALAMQAEVVFLATAHEVSHDLAPQFLEAGCTVLDLSGAFRVNSAEFYTQYYGFTHKHPQWLDRAVYGLAEWQAEAIPHAQLIAVPGCYPTASQLGLKPLIEAQLLDTDQWPMINAISGVSGAGRKASLTGSVCEVSLQPYGVFTHRHQPEIAAHLGVPVIFTPHLGNFPRGILATMTAKLRSGVTVEQIQQAYANAYINQPLVRLYPSGWPSIRAVVGTPYCDIGFALQGEHVIVVAAEDNLLKGAAAQAMQCLNLRYGFAQTCALI
ncbi:N-acetyl-gamma-glutamyl-phosphate reductase [Plesiomonas sp.]|uniref:N-acetyl-gamma-glutamyl-phosphate reductase n=1 Tax=Plesiomonas sp. TaxID=2486279 RepID=UPI003F34AE06